MKRILSFVLLIFSLLLIPVLMYITIKERELSSFIKTWLYIIIGYVSITCFYVAYYIINKRKKE